MIQHKPVLIPVTQLRANADNPRLAFREGDLNALRVSLDEFGLADTLQVAAEPGGLFLVLNGNDRLREAQEAGVGELWCVILPDMAYDLPDAHARRMEFVLAFDAIGKKFCKEKVQARITEAIASGSSNERLSSLLNRSVTPRKSRKGAAEEDPERATRVAEAISGAAARATALATLTIQGPAEDIARVREILGTLREEISSSRTLIEVLGAARASIPGEDEAFLSVFLATLARHKAALSGA